MQIRPDMIDENTVVRIIARNGCASVDSISAEIGILNAAPIVRNILIDLEAEGLIRKSDSESKAAAQLYELVR